MGFMPLNARVFRLTGGVYEHKSKGFPFVYTSAQRVNDIKQVGETYGRYRLRPCQHTRTKSRFTT